MKNVVVQVLNNFCRSCRKLLGAGPMSCILNFCSQKSGRLPLPSGQGLMSEEPEAHTFKRFEMIIRI
jgi:hypothetical protein